MSVEVEIEARLAECTEWGLSRVYRFEGDPPGAELKLTLTRGQESFPAIKEGAKVLVILSWEEEEEEEEDPGYDITPGPDGTKCPYGRCDGSGVIPRRWGRGAYDVDLEPCECNIDRIVKEHAAAAKAAIASLLDPEPFGAPGPTGRCPRCDNRGVTLDGEPCDCKERP